MSSNSSSPAWVTCVSNLADQWKYFIRLAVVSRVNRKLVHFCLFHSTELHKLHWSVTVLSQFFKYTFIVIFLYLFTSLPAAAAASNKFTSNLLFHLFSWPTSIRPGSLLSRCCTIILNYYKDCIIRQYVNDQSYSAVRRELKNNQDDRRKLDFSECNESHFHPVHTKTDLPSKPKHLHNTHR